MTLSRLEREALASLDLDGLVTFLRELIALPTVTGSPEESLAQHWLAGVYADAGLDVDLWEIPVPDVTARADFPGMEASREEAWGLVGTYGGHAAPGPTFVLGGHVDVVPPGDVTQWSRGPYSALLEDGVVYGRGACDMKGGLACNLFALKAVQLTGARLHGRVALHSVVSEEDGGLGTYGTLLRGHRGDAAVVTEPTNGRIVPANAGALTFRLRVQGRAAHAGVRQEGVSAIERFWPLWRALERLEARRNAVAEPLMTRYPLPYPLSIGTLRAGDWPSSVPDELTAEGRLGVRLGEELDHARRDLEETVAAACSEDAWLARHPAVVEWFGGQFASGRLPDGHPLLDLMARCHADRHGNAPEIHGAPYGSDLRLLLRDGVPALHYGPGDVRHAHAPDERVPIAQLRAVAETLILAILRFCAVAA